MKNRSLLMIPGPIEFDPAVLAAMGAPTTGHLAPIFIEAFGQALERTRALFQCKNGQPFVLAGTGTLGMDTACANLVEAGDNALVVNTGYFGDRIGAILERYGAKVTHLRPAPGLHPALADVEAALKAGSYKVMTITHVDTSTGVLADIKNLAALGKKYGALVIVDGVCFRGRRRTGHGRLGGGCGLHSLAESRRRSARTGPAGGFTQSARSVESPQDTRGQLLCRLEQLAAVDAGL
jgi:alanine-glyoxylate transaminase/serine-glyoxylate transaminase/serine-pyruvate transaminase